MPVYNTGISHQIQVAIFTNEVSLPRSAFPLAQGAKKNAPKQSMEAFFEAKIFQEAASFLEDG